MFGSKEGVSKIDDDIKSNFDEDKLVICRNIYEFVEKLLLSEVFLDLLETSTEINLIKHGICIYSCDINDNQSSGLFMDFFGSINHIIYPKSKSYANFTIKFGGPIEMSFCLSKNYL